MFRRGLIIAIFCQLLWPSVAAATSVTIASNFNGTPIPADGRFLWFSAHLSSFPTEAGTLFFSGQQIFVDDPTVGEDRTYSVPNALISFLTGTGTQTTSFNTSLNQWETTIFLGSSKNDPFFAGLAVQPGVNHQASNPVTWSGQVITPSLNFQNHTFQWQWSAAVYTCFSTDYNTLGVLPVDSGGQSGTPTTYAGDTDCVTGGARGGGGSNFTGSNSATGSFIPTEGEISASLVAAPEPGSLTLLGLGLGLAGIARFANRRHGR